MKTKKVIIDARRDALLKELKTAGHLTVDELVERLHVSPLTIRRDLQYLNDHGFIERFYGGASIIDFVGTEHDPASSNEPYKHAIAKYAAQYVKDNDVLFINTSSTALLLLSYIKGKRVTVVTNNGKAIFIDHDPMITIVLCGGELRFPKESMVGDFALNNLNKVTVNKCFLGCSGIDVHSGISTSIIQEVSINEAMIRRCNGPVFILADSTEVGLVHQFNACDIHAIQYLITDKRLKPDQLDEFLDAGINTICLDPLYNFDSKYA